MQMIGMVIKAAGYHRGWNSMEPPTPGEQDHHWSGISTSPTTLLICVLLFKIFVFFNLLRHSELHKFPPKTRWYNNYCTIREYSKHICSNPGLQIQTWLIGSFLPSLWVTVVTNLQKCGADLFVGKNVAEIICAIFAPGWQLHVTLYTSLATDGSRRWGVLILVVVFGTASVSPSLFLLRETHLANPVRWENLSSSDWLEIWDLVRKSKMGCCVLVRLAEKNFNGVSWMELEHLWLSAGILEEENIQYSIRRRKYGKNTLFVEKIILRE